MIATKLAKKKWTQCVNLIFRGDKLSGFRIENNTQ
jgi:hypothetical protein